MSESRTRGILRLKHLRETTEAVAEDMGEERGRFDRLANDESRPAVVSAYNLFQTPEDLAELMASHVATRARILEPSAGLGRLYRAVRLCNPHAHITLVDESQDCCRELYRETNGDQAARLLTADFLSLTAQGLGEFDGIIMNPPFQRGTDIRHILHASRMLAHGGKLVALCADGPRQRKELIPVCSTWRQLPESTFKSEGTRVRAALLTIVVN